MKKALISLFAFLLIASVVGAAVTDEYRVFLKDGSWLRAKGQPVIQNGQARIRLIHGQLTLLPAGRIDWETSERWNREAQRSAGEEAAKALPQPTTHLSGPITMIREDESESEEGAAEPAAAAEATGDSESANDDAAAEAAPAAETAPAAEKNDEAIADARLRQRISALDKQMQDLRNQKAALEKRASTAVRVEDSETFRSQAQALGDRIQRLRSEQNALILRLSGRKE